MSTTGVETSKVVYWHRELPPLDAESIGQHTVEATRVGSPTRKLQGTQRAG
jgi:hypothetical protein